MEKKEYGNKPKTGYSQFCSLRQILSFISKTRILSRPLHSMDGEKKGKTEMSEG